MNAKDRLLTFLKYLGIGQNAFEKKVGIANGYIAHNKGSIGSSIVHKISAVYPQLNIDWLLTGEGEMLKAESKKEMYPTAYEQTAKRIAEDFRAQYGNTQEGRDALEKFTEERIMERFTYARDILIGLYEKGQIYSAATVKQMLAERDERLVEKDEKIEQLQRKVWELEELLKKHEK